VVAEEKDGQLAALIEKDGDAEGGDLVLGSCAGAEEAEQQGVLKSPRRAGGLDIDVGLSLSEDHEQLVEEARLMLAMIDGHHLAYWQSRYDDELTRVEMMSEAGGAATGALFTWYVLSPVLHCSQASGGKVMVCPGTAMIALALLWRLRFSSSRPSMAWTTATRVRRVTCQLFNCGCTAFVAAVVDTLAQQLTTARWSSSSSNWQECGRSTLAAATGSSAACLPAAAWAR
jgi:hypothetical protein